MTKIRLNGRKFGISEPLYFSLFFTGLFSGLQSIESIGNNYYYLLYAIIIVSIFLQGIKIAKVDVFLLAIFIIISLLNGTRIEKMPLAIASIFILINAKCIGQTDRADEDLFSLILLTSSVITSGLLYIYIDYSSFSTGKFEGFEGRLRLTTMEASYLGFIAASFFVLCVKRYIRYLWAGILTLTVSGYGGFWFLVIRYTYIAVVLFFIYLVGLIYALLTSPNDFFWLENSGYVRFIGLMLYDQYTFYTLLFGNGIGAGDELLTFLYGSTYGVDFRGFLFSLIFDLGLINFMIFSYFACKTFKEFIVLAVLLSNFGAFLPFVPLGLIIFRKAMIKLEVS